MISFEDCLAFSGLTEAEVAAIAEHGRMPQVSPAVLDRYLPHQHRGLDHVHQMIVEDARAALAARDSRRAAELLNVLHKFMSGAAILHNQEQMR